MLLQINLDERLWLAIQPTYSKGDYRGAVTDAIHFLSELIRNKSGLDGDGVPLVGAAFGGQNPIIKVNSLQTESEQNEQKGVAEMLRGLYQGIRNPRSHSKMDDPPETANEILALINFLVRN